MMLRYSSLALLSLLQYTASVSANGTSDTANTGVYFHIARRQALSIRQNIELCLNSQVSCDSSCIDKYFECCHVGQGQACEQGYYCYSQGCCRAGQTCSGPPKGCTPTTKMCDIGCIPRDRVCCDYGDGSSCDADTVCLKSGMCGRWQTDLGGSDGTQSPNSTPGTIFSFSPGTILMTDTGSDGLNSAQQTTVVAGSTSSGRYNLSPVTTTESQNETPTAPSKSSSSTKTPKSTTSAGSSSASSNKDAAGATLKAPAILAGLLAMAAYAI